MPEDCAAVGPTRGSLGSKEVRFFEYSSKLLPDCILTHPLRCGRRARALAWRDSDDAGRASDTAGRGAKADTPTVQASAMLNASPSPLPTMCLLISAVVRDVLGLTPTTGFRGLGRFMQIPPPVE